MPFCLIPAIFPPLPKKHQAPHQELRELSCRATLDVPGSAARAISGWLATHRKQVTAKLWQRAAACWTQTVLVLR